MPGLRHELVVRCREAGVAYPGAPERVHFHLFKQRGASVVGAVGPTAGKQPDAGVLVALFRQSEQPFLNALHLSQWKRKLCLDVVRCKDAERPAEAVPCIMRRALIRSSASARLGKRQQFEATSVTASGLTCDQDARRLAFAITIQQAAQCRQHALSAGPH